MNARLQEIVWPAELILSEVFKVKIQTAAKLSGIVEDSLRKPGPLGLFGIDKLLHVPLILPKTFHDYSNPTVDFEKIQPGGQVCIAGLPKACVSIEAPPSQCELSDAENDTVLVEILETDDDQTPHHSIPKNYSFWLFDDKGSNPISVRVSVETKAERILFERASSGQPLYLYGDLSLLPDGSMMIEQPEMIQITDRGRIYARYPSKSKTVIVDTKSRSAKQTAKGTPRKPKTQKRILYSLTVAGLVQERLRLGIPACAGYLRDRLYLSEGPSEWRLMQTLEAPDISIEGTLWQSHHPRSIADGYAAIKALERLSAVESLLLVHKDRENRLDHSSKIRIKRGCYPDLKHQLFRTSGITMTAEQNAGACQILYDLVSPYVMHRALSGDPGSGKTIVFGIVAATLAASGYLVVILEPTTSVAHQVYNNLSSYWPHLEFQLILGDSAGTNLLKAGIIVGTTAIWSRMVAAELLPHCIIIDEQHKFGTGQRSINGKSINTIEASGTPIPRSQGLIEFSGLDVTELRGCHVRKTIHTRLVEGKDAVAATLKTLIKQIKRREINLAAIYPLIYEEDNDDENIRSVAEAFNYWNGIFPDRVVAIHGRMPDVEKLAAIELFSKGNADIIVGTTVLEVGLDFPKLDAMMVHNPERLGVATVHQLRGRLARRGGEGHCYLMCPDPIDENRRQLFLTMESENDGFELARLDMIRRGLGDLRKQSRQQSGNYAGFLVDRSASMEDLFFVIDHCQEWIGMTKSSLDLFDQKAIQTSFLDAPSRSRETPYSGASSSSGLAGPCVQLSLLPD